MAKAAPTLDAILATVSSDRRVSVPLDDIADAMRVSLRSLMDGLREAEAMGYLQFWRDVNSGHGKGSILATLTPSVAARIGLIPDDVGRYWLRAGEAPRKRWGGGQTREVAETDYFARSTSGGDVAGLDGFPDRKSVDPLDQAADDELAEILAAAAGVVEIDGESILDWYDRRRNSDIERMLRAMENTHPEIAAKVQELIDQANPPSGTSAA